MSFEEWALVIYSLVCTIALIRTGLALNDCEEYFQAYQKMTEIIEKRLRKEIKRLKDES